MPATLAQALLLGPFLAPPPDDPVDLALGDAHRGELTKTDAAITTDRLTRLRVGDDEAPADRFRFTSSDEGWIQVELRSDAFDGYLILRSPDGDRRFETDGGISDRACVAHWRLAANETLEILVTTVGHERGAYDLVVDDTSENDLLQLDRKSGTPFAASVDDRLADADPAALAWRLEYVAYDDESVQDLDPALARYEAALDARRRSVGDDHPLFAKTLRWRAAFLRRAARYPEARADLDRALEIFRGTLGHLDAHTGETLRQLAIVDWRTGRFAEAEANALAAVVSNTAAYGANHLEVARARENQASAVAKQARFQDAETLFLEADATARDVFGLVEGFPTLVMNNLGTMYIRAERYEEAERIYLDVIPIRERAKSTGALADALNNLAVAYKQQGRFADAEPLYRRVLDIDKEELSPTHPYVASGLNNIAMLYQAQGRDDEAQALFEEGIGILESLEDRSSQQLAGYYGNLANLYEEREQLDDALALHRKAYALYVEVGNESYLAESEEDLGRILLETGDAAGGLAFMESALDRRIGVFGEDHRQVARTRSELAEFRIVAGDPDAAVELLDGAIEVLEVSRGAPEDRIEAYHRRARARHAAGDLERALADVDRAMTTAEDLRPQASGAERERGLLLWEFAEVFDDAVRFALDAGAVDRAFHAAERGRARAFLDQLSVASIDLVASIPDDERAAFETREKELEARMAELVARTRYIATSDDAPANGRDDALREVEAALAEAQAEYESLWTDARASSALYRTVVSASGDVLTLADAQRRIVGRTDVMALYYVGAKFSALLVVPPAGEDAVGVELVVGEDEAAALGVPAGPLGAESLNAAVELVRSGGGLSPDVRGVDEEDDAAPRSDAALRALGNVLLPARARGVLAGDDVGRVIVSPDGALRRIPIEMLRYDDERYVLEALPPVLVAPSATVLHQLVRRAIERGVVDTDEATVLTVGDVLFARVDGTAGAAPTFATTRASALWSGGAPKPLPATGAESDAIAGLFSEDGVVQLKGADATEARLRASLEGKRIVHLASHAVAETSNSNLFGALLLAPPEDGEPDAANDGLLTLAEIYELPLGACDLAVLSACETGVGAESRGDAAFTLLRGFLVSGADRVVASHWPVEDRSTADLMQSFLEPVARARGRNVDHVKALRNAKLALLANERTADPFFWAPFVLVGLP